MRLTRLALFSCLLLACSGSHAGDSADDLAKWQGTWNLVSCTYDGEPQMRDMQWIVHGDHYTVRLDQQSQETAIRLKLDAGRKHVDATHHETPPGTYGGKFKGTYTVSGDSLTVCYDLTGRDYPSSFDATRGSRRVLYRFEKVRP